MPTRNYVRSLVTLGYMQPDLNEIVNYYDSIGMDGMAQDFIEDPDEMLSEYENNTFENVLCDLERCDFDILEVSLKVGYYQGFQVIVEIPEYYYENDTDFLKETHELKKFLMLCLENYGMRTFTSTLYFTTFGNYGETKASINSSVDEIRKMIMGKEENL